MPSLTGADSDDASPVAASSLRRHVTPLHLRLDVSSPATARSHRSNRRAQALRANPSRPARSAPSWPERAPLLRFGPLQHSSAASRCPGRRPASLGRSRFGVSRCRARARVREPRPAALRPCGFTLLTGSRQWQCFGWRAFGMGRSIVPQTCPVRFAAASGHAFDDREDAIPVVFDPPGG